MEKRKFVAEFEINASKKMLFPYLSTASGLSQWYAEDVTIDEDKIYHLYWDEADHPAKLVQQRLNEYVKFEFIADPEPEGTSKVEFHLEENELTQAVFIRIVDYTDDDDDEELRDIWEGLVNTLRETVGG